MKKLFITIIAMLMPLMASAQSQSATIDGFSYSLDSSTKTAIFTRGTYSGDVIIPPQVTYGGMTYTVTSIGEGAFGEMEDVTSITIPSCVKEIGEGALTCNNVLIHITDLEAWCSVNVHSAFEGYRGKPFYHRMYLNGKEIKDLVIPSGVTSISRDVFSGCTSFTSVTIPNSVTSIGYAAFMRCSNLTSITIPNSVTSIGNSAFSGCTKLTTLTIAPGSVVEISGYAFYGCTKLSTLNIPSSVTKIDEGVFNETGWYNSQPNGLVYAGNVAYKYKGTMPENTSITIKDGTLGVGKDAFSGCRGLASVAIPNSVTSIGVGAFEGCSGLTSITIPNSVTSIGAWAFEGCSGLTSITIPNSVTSMGEYVFSRCSGLTYIEIPNSVTSIGQDAFSGTGWYNNQPDGLVYAGKVAYKYKGTMPNNTSITIKEGTLGIADHAFNNCSNLTSITIPNSVTSIGDWAFSSCGGLTSITIPSSVTSIGSYAFSYCGGLTSITIPNSVTSIGYYAFMGCSGLTSITIPNSVTSIGYWAFYGCRGLTSVTIPNSVTSIENGAFQYCRGLTSISIPNSVTSIGDWAFSSCGGLTSITIPNSVTSIGRYAFDGCNNLQFICLTSDKYPSTQSLGTTNCQYIMPQSAFDGGIPTYITNYATYGVTPMYVKVKSKTATSAVFELRPVNDPEDAVYTVTTYGQTPGQNLRWKLDDQNYGIVSEKANETLTLEVQPAQPTSTTKARLIANVNEPNDDKHYGFEWRRIGVDDLVPSNVVYSQLYDGHIVGTLSNLNPDISYKYRPFYKSDSGETFYGEWIGFLTGDANVFFEPEVHTNEPVALTENGAQLSGVWIEGTEDTQEKGIEFWPKNSGVRSTRAGNVTAVIVKGNNTSVTLEGLEPGTEYVYRSYLRTASGTVYGEEKTFKTPLLGDANDDGKVNVADIVEVVNAKAGKPSASFNMTNADVDGNGSITEAEIVKIIMQK